MEYKFPIPKDDDELCELIKFIDSRRIKIRDNIKKLTLEKRFSTNNVNPNIVEKVDVGRFLPFIIAYMEFFNQN